MATLVAIIGVDRVGRKILFIAAGIFMVACEITIGVVLGHYFEINGSKLPNNVSNGVLAVICLYVANFAWSWGMPLVFYPSFLFYYMICDARYSKIRHIF